MAPLTEQLQQAIADHKDELWKLNQEVPHQLSLPIWSHPELGYKEYQAHDNITNYLEGLGYTVRRHAYGLETSFEAELQVGEGGGLLVYNAEYDSLPGIGHACGHNLIATSSIAAFVLTAEAMKANGIAGTVRLLGTPAEETEGGKIKLIEAGAFKGVDACLMGHPVPKVAPVHGVVSPGMNACTHATVTFHGLNAHAGNAPWLGKNALDAAVQAYTSMSMLRQQIEPSQRIHAIITKGGDKPNIIPHLTEMEVVARAQKTEPMEETVKRLNACFEGAAAAAGCTVDIEW
ncbi:hypothetical protein KEM55_000543 [Ascosphaera atra]|nr:hypothetical protein KEM55_000543 [Ascosphaera atra]